MVKLLNFSVRHKNAKLQEICTNSSYQTNAKVSRPRMLKIPRFSNFNTSGIHFDENKYASNCPKIPKRTIFMKSFSFAEHVPREIFRYSANTRTNKAMIFAITTSLVEHRASYLTYQQAISRITYATITFSLYVVQVL